MKKSKRLLSLALVFVLALTMVLPVTAIPSDIDYANARELQIIEGEDGLYTIVNSSMYTLSSNVVTVSQMNGTGDIYYDPGTELSLFMRVSENNMVLADKISIDPHDPSDIEQKVALYGLSDYVLNDLLELSQQCTNGETFVDSLSVYVPAEHEVTTRGITTHTRTYTGYKNKTYYEELVVFSGNSVPFDVRTPSTSVGQYAENVLIASAETLMSSALDFVSGGAWSIVSVFAQSAGYDSIQTQTAYKHTAALIENKSRKWTFVCEGNDKFIGSALDYATMYRFKNYLNIDGFDIIEGEDSPWQHYKVYGWDIADELAYRNYGTNAYIDYITAYDYINSTYDLSASVASQFR